MNFKHRHCAAVLLSICSMASMGLAPTDGAADDKAKPNRDAPTNAKTREGAPSSPLIARASELLEKKVRNEQGELLGHIEDIVVDQRHDRIAYFVLHLEAGYFDAGGKYFAFPFHALKEHISRAHLLPDVSKEKLEQQRGFDKDDWPDMTSREWAIELHKHYGVEPYWQAPRDQRKPNREPSDVGQKNPSAPAGRDPDAERAEAREAEKPQADQQSTGPGIDNKHQWVHRVSGLIDKEVHNDQDEDLGSLKDIVVDMREGRLAYGVITDGGIIGVGVREELTVVPWSKLTPIAGTETLRLAATKQKLKRFSFKESGWPDMSDQKWAVALHEHFEAEPYWSILATPRTDQPAYDAAWQAGAAYARLYQRNREKSIEGAVTSVGTFSLAGSKAAGSQFIMRSERGENWTVHMGPAAFVRSKGLELQEGDAVKVIGCEAQHDGRAVILARQVRKDGTVIELRDAMGTPVWSKDKASEDEGGGSPSSPRQDPAPK